MCIQSDVVDDIPTIKFVYLLWMGENCKPMSKAKFSTRKGDLEEVFKVKPSLLLEYKA